MGFSVGSYATVWEITERFDKYAKVRLTTSRKDAATDKYVTDFSGFVTLVGDAFKRLDEIEDVIGDKGRCSIKITGCSVTNRYDKDAGREYVNYLVFGFEAPDADNGGNKNKAQKPSNGGQRTSQKAPPKKSTKAAPLVSLDDDEEDDDDVPW